MTPEQEREWREEADRLKLIDRADQRRVIAMLRDSTRNKNVGKRDRDLALARANALERFLGLSKRNPRRQAKRGSTSSRKRG
jgi:hypothetical protein